MRDRLIELLTDRLPRIGDLPKCDNPLRYTDDEIVERLADHLLTNGVIVLPCKIGTEIYRIVPDLSFIYPDPNEFRVMQDTFKLSDIYTFGKTVFLTREEAERSIK